MLNDNKIGLFICHRGKGTKEPIDTDDLKKVAGSFPQIQVIEDLYQDQWETSASLLTRTVSEKGLSQVVIATCHSSNYQHTFRQELNQSGLRPDQVSIINVLPEYLGVREEPEVVRERSSLLLRQTIRHGQWAESHPVEALETIPRILIIGGDRTAFEAARRALSLGYPVLVLTGSKEIAQGGYHAGSRPESDYWNSLAQQPGFRSITNSRLIHLSGQAGNFECVFQDGDNRICREGIGAVIVALPAQEDPNFDSYGLEPGRKILSLSQLETMLQSPAYQEKLLPNNRLNEVAFLVGLSSESTPGVVGRALTLARAVQEVSDSQVYFLSGNMKVAGQDLERIYTRAREEGMQFFRFDHGRPQFKETREGLEITFRDEILERPLALCPDIIVVDERLIPHPEMKATAAALGIPLDEAGFMAPDQVYGLPVRTPRKGIFAIGGSRRPISVGRDSLCEAQEAVLSAAELIGKGIREVEASRVEVDRKKCTICLTCVRSCPHQAISFLYRRPQISPLACQVCGVCAAECPMDAIQIKEYRDRTINGEISVFFSQRRYDTMTPQVVVFCCKNSADKTLQQVLLYRNPLPIGFEFIQVPCAGKIDPDYILHALREGADGVLVLSCPIDSCQSFEGNKMALERVRYLKEVLEETGMNPDRLQFETVAPGMASQFLNICYQIEDRFRKLGVSRVRHGQGIRRIYEKFTFPADSKTFLI